MSSTRRISPTAHATGHMWHRHGLSHPGLVSHRGRFFDAAFSGVTGLVEKGTGVSFDALMLARHQGIDGLLDAAIASGRVSQVIELAAGLSPRGWRFSQRYGERLRYVETDLPHMGEEKRRRLQRAGLTRNGHEVIAVDVLQPQGPQSLAAVADRLDPEQGTAIITEGLMSYLSPEQAAGVWQRIAETLGRFPQGVYLSDFYLSGENRGWMLGAFRSVLQSFVRGRLHVHFATAEEARRALLSQGFDQLAVHRTADLDSTRNLSQRPGADRVRILEAWVGP